MRYCGACATSVYCSPVSGLTQNEGAIWLLPESEISTLLATSCWVKPSCCARLRSAIDVQLRLIERLLDAQVDHAGNVPQRCQQLIGEVAVLRARADHLHVEGRRQSEIQDLADDVGGQESEGGAGKFAAAGRARSART